MIRKLFAVLCVCVALYGCAVTSGGDGGALQPLDLRCEHRVDPLGIGETQPLLSWRVENPAQNGRSVSAWRVLAASTNARLAADRGDRWDSGVVRDGDVLTAAWGGAPLGAGAEVHWKVRVWDGDGVASEWSAPARFSVGLLGSADWTADWIGAPDADTAERASAPWLRTTIDLPAAPRRAVEHVASLGYHELWLDGERCGDAVLMPSVSDLSKRARAVTYDVTGRLHAGANALGLWLGSGWAANARYGVAAYPLARAQLEVELADGRVLHFATGPDWRVSQSSTRHIGPWGFGSYGGERVDADAAHTDWCTLAAGADVARWPHARVFPVDVAIVAEACEPTRRVEQIEPVAVEELRPGVWRVDFGRAFTGFTRARLSGEPCATVALRFSERDDEETTYGQASELVLDTAGEGVFEQRFNYACARWLTIEGCARAPQLADVRGFLVRSDYARSARFACSDPLLQSVHDAVAWTFECLSLGGYTVDCAHRERWGYGGDAHATMETALDHFGMAAFYAKWLDDWAAIQNEHGNLPFTCPTYRGGGGPAWSGIVVMLPWETYLRCGDRRVLERAWPTIERWLAFLETQTVDGVLQFYADPRYVEAVYSFLGDWVPPGEEQAGGPATENTLFFNNAYRVWNVRTAVRIAQALGRDRDAARLRARAEELAAAVHARFFDPQLRVYVSPRQTYLALPVLAGLGDASLRAELLTRLYADIETRRHVDTGIHGTWMLTKLLLEERRADLLALVAAQHDFPSWGDMLARGATTIWEQWDGVNSRMHSSFLSIGALFVEGLAGIRPLADGPGYAHFALEPAFVPGLHSARCELDTPRGRIICGWQCDENFLRLEIDVPVGSRARLRLPVASLAGVPGGPLAAARDFGAGPATIVGDDVEIEVPAGRYRALVPRSAAGAGSRPEH